MMSRPNFEVDIVKSNGKTLSFTCTYVHPDEMAQEGEGPGKPPPPEKCRMYLQRLRLDQMQRSEIKGIECLPQTLIF